MVFQSLDKAHKPYQRGQSCGANAGGGKGVLQGRGVVRAVPQSPVPGKGHHGISKRRRTWLIISIRERRNFMIGGKIWQRSANSSAESRLSKNGKVRFMIPIFSGAPAEMEKGLLFLQSLDR
jgi:hypothetical protein